jgi:hypothetical protein
MNGQWNAGAILRAALVVAALLILRGMGLETSTVCAAEPQVIVNVTSGRQFAGVVDEASDAQQLVLRSDHGSIKLWRPIRWERVVSATVDGKPLDVSSLKNMAAQAPEDRAQDIGQRPLLRSIEMRGEPSLSDSSQPEAADTWQPRVAMVAFDASIANWDADVETDGVLIDVAPFDVNRRVVPVSATVEVELFAPQRRTLDLAPQSGGDTLELVERWTRAITPDDFGPSGVRLRLPFGAITPELQPNWTAWHYGLVHVRLSVPGHGVFDDTRDGIRIRPWAPNRDRLEMKTGQRFLGTEYMNRRD